MSLNKRINRLIIVSNVSLRIKIVLIKKFVKDNNYLNRLSIKKFS